MTETHDSWIRRVGQWSLVSRAGLLLVLFAAYWLAVVPVAVGLGGTRGVAAATLATLACLFSGWLAMLVTHWFAPPTKPAAHVVVGMLIRMSLPLLVCLGVILRAEWLAKAGFAWYLVAAFCLGLAVETLISVGQLQSGPHFVGGLSPTRSRPGASGQPSADQAELGAS